MLQSKRKYHEKEGLDEINTSQVKSPGVFHITCFSKSVGSSHSDNEHGLFVEGFLCGHLLLAKFGGIQTNNP